MSVIPAGNSWEMELPLLRLAVQLRRHQSLLEEDIERALLRMVRQRYAGESGIRVYRQLRCHALKPDLVVVSHAINRVVIVEIKREIAGDRALSQISGYVDHFGGHCDTDAGAWTVRGLLAAPAIRPAVLADLPDAISFQPLAINVRRAA